MSKPPKKVKPDKYNIKCPRCKTKYKKKESDPRLHEFEENHPSRLWGEPYTIHLVCIVCGRRLSFIVHKDKKNKNN